MSLRVFLIRRMCLTRTEKSMMLLQVLATWQRQKRQAWELACVPETRVLWCASLAGDFCRLQLESWSRRETSVLLLDLLAQQQHLYNSMNNARMAAILSLILYYVLHGLQPNVQSNILYELQNGNWSSKHLLGWFLLAKEIGVVIDKSKNLSEKTPELEKKKQK